VKIPGFIGPTNTLRATDAGVDQTINWMLEATAPGVSKNALWMPPTPGLSVFTTIPGSAVTATWAQDGRAFACGTNFSEITSTGAVTNYGVLATNSDAPTISSNGTAGNQLFITSGGNGYIFNLTTNVLTLIADADFPNGSAKMGAFMDGYFLVLKSSSRQFQISALEDGTTWDGLAIGQRSEGSDNLQALVRSHREIWLLGSQTSEVWYDNGDTFPFAPIQGVFLEYGTAAPFTVCRLGQTLVWVGQDEDGQGVVWMADGYTPKVISTPSINAYIQDAGFTSARAWTYQADGHQFYILMLPSADKTPVYDLTTGAWHFRATWDPSACVWLPYRPQCHMYAFNTHLVGDRSTGTIYTMSASVYTESLV
jgi:hypothetical protein